MDPNIDNHHQRRHYHHRHHNIALLPMLFGLQPLPRSTQQAPATWDRFGRPCFRLGIMEQKGAALQTKVDERDPPPAKRGREVSSTLGHRSVCTHSSRVSQAMPSTWVDGRGASEHTGGSPQSLVGTQQDVCSTVPALQTQPGEREPTLPAWSMPNLVVLDEPGQVTEPLCLIRMTLSAEQGHVAFVGDHTQLLPLETTQRVGAQPFRASPAK